MRYKELDGIRGLAALSVVLFHLTTPKINAFIETENVIPEYLHFSYGNYGVEIFFILSGFVILFSLERKKSYRDFLWARFLRLYPTFWICLLLSTIVLITIYPGDTEQNLKNYQENRVKEICHKDQKLYDYIKSVISNN